MVEDQNVVERPLTGCCSHWAGALWGEVVLDEVRDPSASLGDWLPYAFAFAWGGSRIGITERRTGPVSPRFAFRSGNALWVAKLGHNVGNSRGKVIRRCVF